MVSQSCDIYSSTEKYIVANKTKDNSKILSSDGEREKHAVFRALQLMCYTTYFIKSNIKSFFHATPCLGDVFGFCKNTSKSFLFGHLYYHLINI